VAIVPVASGAVDRDVAAALEKALANGASGGTRLIAAVGRIERGVSGVAASYRQAIRTLDAARALGMCDQTFCYTDTVPLILLLNDPATAADLYRATIEPLERQDDANGTHLVATLDALLSERGNVLAAAKRLFVHRHTLTARIERIESLTHRDLRSRRDLLLLELGLRAQVLNPPSAALTEFLDGSSRP
ncbi:MAG: PucR family transcriptional regulator, partial [Vicinamibacterales bacterium]